MLVELAPKIIRGHLGSVVGLVVDIVGGAYCVVVDNLLGQ